MRRTGDSRPLSPGSYNRLPLPRVRPQYPFPFPCARFSDTSIDKNMNKLGSQQGNARGKFRTQGKKKMEMEEAATDVDDRSVEERCLDEEAAKEVELSKVNCTNFQPSTEVLDFLSFHGLVLLSRPNPKLPWARWFCNICKFHCKDLTKVKEHLASSRHEASFQRLELLTTLKLLPPPTQNHLRGIESMLDTVVTLVGLSPEDLIHRATVTSQLEELLRLHIPDCQVQMFGSSLSGFALHDSNLDLNLSSTKLLPQIALKEATFIIKQSGSFRDVEEDSMTNGPMVKFSTLEGLRCELSMGNKSSVQTGLLLRDYLLLNPLVRTLGVALRWWAREVGLDTKTEGTLPSHAFPILLVYFLQKLDVLPCIHEWLEVGEEYSSPQTRLAQWEQEDTTIGKAELWLELFYFLTCQLSEEGVISICQEEGRTEFLGKKLTIEDPFSSRKNLCKNISQSVFEFIPDCFRTSYLYFGSIQTKLGPLVTAIIPTPSKVEKIDVSQWTLESWLASNGTRLTQHQARAAAFLVSKDMVRFSMEQVNLAPRPAPPVQCSVCGMEGHSQRNCPEEVLPSLVSLPELDPRYIVLLDNVCTRVLYDWEPREPELKARDKFMCNLDKYIKNFWPDAILSLFGSSWNGFSFRFSDLDISLTFNNIPNSDDINCVDIVEDLAMRIRKMPGVSRVMAITAAKVPIVKMFHNKFKIEADISLYNVLAGENTRMLAFYASLDDRVKILGYVVKLFAKICNIGDASKGSLSSYAYVLMVIYYLQQISPPVIPVLQQLHPEGTNMPEHIVDGWNAWFFSDRHRLVTEWKGYRKNQSSVGELWLGFLHFYSGAWDDERLVVSIRQQEPLSKQEKTWNSHCIAIEDPFELNHNLGSGLSRKMWLYIKKAFIQAREHFGIPPKKIPTHLLNIQDYYFDRTLLTNGPPPQDRNLSGSICYNCGKNGHIAINCPRKRERSQQQRKVVRRERSKSISEQSVDMDLQKVSELSVSFDCGQEEMKKYNNKEMLLKREDKVKVPYYLRGSELSSPSEKTENKDLKDDISDYFDYNLVKPRHVNEGTIDYFQYSQVDKDEEEIDFITLKDVLTQDCSVGKLSEQYQGHSYGLDRLKSIHMDLLFQCDEILNLCEEKSYGLDRLKSIHMDLLFQCDEILKLCEEKSYTSAIEELEKLRLNLRSDTSLTDLAANFRQVMLCKEAEVNLAKLLREWD